MEKVPLPAPVPWPNREIKGIGWFFGPVLLNALVFLIPVSGLLFPMDTKVKYLLLCNFPYYLMVVVIGMRRARKITATDFLFLVAGNFLIFAIMQELMDWLYTYSRR